MQIQLDSTGLLVPGPTDFIAFAYLPLLTTFIKDARATVPWATLGQRYNSPSILTKVLSLGEKITDNADRLYTTRRIRWQPQYWQVPRILHLKLPRVHEHYRYAVQKLRVNTIRDIAHTDPLMAKWIRKCTATRVAAATTYKNSLPTLQKS